jgi:hypothetical protein
VTLFTQLGLLVHPEKCNFIPSQEIVILGFIINSVKMTVKLTPEKALALKSDCDLFLKKCPGNIAIREVAQIIGKIVSSFPGVLHGPLYYRPFRKGQNLSFS